MKRVVLQVGVLLAAAAAGEYPHEGAHEGPEEDVAWAAHESRQLRQLHRTPDETPGARGVRAPEAYRRSIQDEIEQHEGGVANTGYFFAPQDYGSDGGWRGRRTSHLLGYGGVEWANMRIRYEYVSTGQAGANEAWLKETLLPAAREWLEASLKVHPLRSNLHAARTCTSHWLKADGSNGACYTSRDPTCGAERARAHAHAPAPARAQLPAPRVRSVRGAVPVQPPRAPARHATDLVAHAQRMMGGVGPREDGKGCRTRPRPRGDGMCHSMSRPRRSVRARAVAGAA